MERIHVAYSTDDTYAQFVGVSLCSLFEHKETHTPIDVFILDGGIGDENKSKLNALSEKYGFTLHFIVIDTDFFAWFSIQKHLTQAAYYRLLIADILPGLDKILYLDSDVIIKSDISELYAIDITDYALAAVEQYGQHRFKELNMPKDAKYFNSGVMLINTKRRREAALSQSLISFVQQYPHKLYNQDQDALNAVLQGSWLPLPLKYNYMTLLPKIYPVNYHEWDKTISIIHYTRLKPWNYLCTNPLKKEYFRYLALTPRKHQKFVDKNLKNICIKVYRVVMRFLFPHRIRK